MQGPTHSTLNGSVVLITGASGGIGAELARRLPETMDTGGNKAWK